MTPQRGGEQHQPEVTALLRAVGQLLVAISGDDALPAAQPSAQPAAPPRRPAGEAPAMDEIEQILADARTRARELIDESFDGARAQIEALAAPPEEPPPGSELAEKVRLLEELLGDIDALQQAEAQEPTAPPSEPEPEAATDEPLEAAASEPEPVEAAASEPGLVEAAASEPGPVEAVSPNAGAAVGSVGVERVEAVAWSGAESDGDVLFQPEGGSVLLRVAPVEGFQGLLRVQGALAQLVGVDQAYVEGYAVGEAQLRLTFDSAVAPGALAAALGERLGVAVEAADVSPAERSLRFELG